MGLGDLQDDGIKPNGTNRVEAAKSNRKELGPRQRIHERPIQFFSLLGFIEEEVNRGNKPVHIFMEETNINISIAHPEDRDGLVALEKRFLFSFVAIQERLCVSFHINLCLFPKISTVPHNDTVGSLVSLDGARCGDASGFFEFLGNSTIGPHILCRHKNNNVTHNISKPGEVLLCAIGTIFKVVIMVEGDGRSGSRKFCLKQSRRLCFAGLVRWQNI